MVILLVAKWALFGLLSTATIIARITRNIMTMTPPTISIQMSFLKIAISRVPSYYLLTSVGVDKKIYVVNSKLLNC
ncbi:13138_t:CDS:2 [Ambispora gerdemannii]|uniref:13138_t:CDS:1 n=1 Tax=Ambispora gerdemannii TaxID=144530 RepID=A0A9N9AEL6_9GLOM|nr:13138_t:CDS:2 [Ambispora gerdemannii]